MIRAFGMFVAGVGVLFIVSPIRIMRMMRWSTEPELINKHRRSLALVGVVSLVCGMFLLSR